MIIETNLLHPHWSSTATYASAAKDKLKRPRMDKNYIVNLITYQEALKKLDLKDDMYNIHQNER